MEIDIYKTLFGAAVVVIWYFLQTWVNSVRAEIRSLSERISKNATSIEVLKSDQSSLEKKLDEICRDIREISTYIRTLNHKANE